MADETRVDLTLRHQCLVGALRRSPEDYWPFGDTMKNNSSDCSCDCKHFIPLHVISKTYKGEDNDWGVCTNGKSHRCGLLTFQHQGCPQFEGEET